MKYGAVFLFILSSMGVASAKESGMVIGNDHLWKKSIFQDNVNLNVCWIPAGDIIDIIDVQENNENLGKYDVGYLKAEVASAVKKTWEKYAGIYFNFTATSACDIQVNIKEFDRSKSQVGKVTVGGITYPTQIYLNLTMLRYISRDIPSDQGSSARKKARSYWEKARLQAEKDGTLRATLIKHARRTGVHEFGHAIGIYHEQDRVEDAKKFGDQPDSESVHPGEIPLEYYDPYSIMNYNSYSLVSDYNTGTISYFDRDNQLLPDMPKLSCGDLIAARHLYPPPTSKAALTPCCSEERYGALLTTKPYLTWADFYANNTLCLENADVILGQLTPISCTALAKQAAGGEVCKSPTIATTPMGDMIFRGSNYCDYLEGERPEFQVSSAIIWQRDAPWLQMTVSVPNLKNVHGQKVGLSNPWALYKAVNEKAYTDGPGPLQLEYGSGLDLSMDNRNQIVFKSPLGRGGYDYENGCYCSYESSPPPGTYARYDPEKDSYLVDHTIKSILLRFFVIDGQRRIEYSDNNCSVVKPNSYSSTNILYESAEFSIQSVDNLRLGFFNGTAGNTAPGRPSISSLTTTDNGTGQINVSWSRVTDADSDPLYYFVEVKSENADSFTKYKALSATSLQITGLRRNTRYQVRVSAFDTKERSYSDIQVIQTPDRAEGCSQANTAGVLLSGIPVSMLRRAIPLYDYRKTPTGIGTTNYFHYVNSFCAEYNYDGFNFNEISGLEDVEPTDWIYIEHDGNLQIDIWYQNGDGSLDVASPGTANGNVYRTIEGNVGNLIRLSDYWGKLSGLHAWPLANRIKKIKLTYRSTSAFPRQDRYGRLLILKENPFGINFHGMRINDAVLTAPPYEYISYFGEPIEIELNTFYKNVTFSGTGLYGFKVSGTTNSLYTKKDPALLGLNTYAFTMDNKLLNPFDKVDVSFTLNVKDPPSLLGIRTEQGNVAKFLIIGHSYGLDLIGLEKPIRTIGFQLNGVDVPLTYSDARYWFVCPKGILGKNKLKVTLDGVSLPEMEIRCIGIVSILSSLLLN